METGTLAALIGAVGGAIGTVWGIIKWYAERKARKEAEAKAFQKEAIVTEVSENVKTLIEPIKAQNETQSEQIDKLERIHKEEVGKLQTSINNNELDRLRAEIMIFACNLRNGMKMSDADFKYICKAYDKYHKMGGNSYIDSVMEYIKEEEDKFLNPRHK